MKEKCPHDKTDYRFSSERMQDELYCQKCGKVLAFCTTVSRCSIFDLVLLHSIGQAINPEEPIYERTEYAALPALHTHCCIQMKGGELCLRVPDKVQHKDGKFVVEREWRRPGTEPWNPDFYPMDISESAPSA